MIEVKLTYYPPSGYGGEIVHYATMVTIGELRSFGERDEELIAIKARHAFSVLYNNVEKLREELQDADT